MSERTIAWIFRGAAIWGALILTPIYFLETSVAAPAAHLAAPEYFYGFISAALSFQLVYWTIGGDPQRHRALMPIAVIAKLSFWIPVVILWALGRTATGTFAFSCGDLFLAVAFFAAWRSGGRRA